MIIYIADRYGKVLTTCSSELPQNATLLKDNLTDDLQSGVRVFECTLIATDKVREHAVTGNYVMAYNAPYTIISSTYDTTDNTVYLYCEDAGLDFINKIVGTIAATSKTFQQWIEWVLKTPAESGWQYNFNIPNTSKTLEYTSEANAQERLLDILANYDAEMYFTYEIEGFKWVIRTINFVQKRGNSDKVHQLRINKEVRSIRETSDISNLATVWKMYGKDSKLLQNLSGYSSVPKTYNKGNHTYKVVGSEVRCLEAMDKWKSALDTSGSIRQLKYTDYSTAKDCIDYAIREMEKIVEPLLSYEVEFVYLPKDIQCGDYVYVLDDVDNILLKARVQSWSKSESDGIEEATLCDYVLLEGSKVEFNPTPSDINIYALSITTSTGYVGEGSISTVLTVLINHNGNIITDSSGLTEGHLVWYEDGTAVPTSDSRITDDGFTFTVTDAEVGAAYKCRLEA